MAAAGVHGEPVRCSLAPTAHGGISERRDDAQYGEASEDDHHRPVVLLLSLHDRDDDRGNDDASEKSWRLAPANEAEGHAEDGSDSKAPWRGQPLVMSMYRVAWVT